MRPPESRKGFPVAPPSAPKSRSDLEVLLRLVELLGRLLDRLFPLRAAIEVLEELPELLPVILAGLLAAGRSPQTPVGVFARVSRADAQSSVGVLDELPELVQRVGGGPAILIVGDVVAHSAPWRASQLVQLVSHFQVAAE